MTNNTLAQQLIHAVEQADSAAKLLAAVQNLAAARLEETIPILIAALGYNNPGAAVAAVDGLIAIGEPAVQPLLELIDGYNYGARAWAIRALAGIGDPRALHTLLDAAKNDFSFSVRRGAAKGLGNISWHLLPPKEIPGAQVQSLEALLQVSQDPEWIVRYAAVVGLQSLGKAVSISHPSLLTQIFSQLQQMAEQDLEITIRARVQMAQQHLQEGALVS
jgi:phycocyanobilin lyase beta subunit